MAQSMLSRFVSGTFATASGKIMTVGLSFFTVVIVTRTLTAEDYGAFVLLRVFALFLAQISAFGLDTTMPVIINATQDPDEQRRIVNTVMIFRTSVVICVSIFGLIFRDEIATFLGSAVIPAELIIYLPLMLLAEAAYVLTQSMLQSFFQFRQMGTNDVLLSTSNFGLMILLVVILQVGVVGLVFARLGAQVLVLSQAINAIPVQKRFEFDWPKLRHILRKGLPLQVNDVLSFLFNRIDTFIVAGLLGTAGVAFYEVGRRIPDNLRMIYDAFRAVFFPFVSKLYAERNLDQLRDLIHTALRYVSFVTLCGALAAVLVGEPIFRALFSEQYVPAVPVFTIAMITLSLRLVGNILGVSVVAVGDTDKPAITSAIYMLTTLGGNLILIPLLGLVGAALTGLIGVMIVSPIDYYFLRRHVPGLSPVSYVRNIMLYACFMFAAVWVAPAPVLVALAFALAFLGAAFLLGIVRPHEIRQIVTTARSLIGKRLQKRAPA